MNSAICTRMIQPIIDRSLLLLPPLWNKSLFFIDISCKKKHCVKVKWCYYVTNTRQFREVMRQDHNCVHIHNTFFLQSYSQCSKVAFFFSFHCEVCGFHASNMTIKLILYQLSYNWIFMPSMYEVLQKETLRK